MAFAKATHTELRPEKKLGLGQTFFFLLSMQVLINHSLRLFIGGGSVIVVDCSLEGVLFSFTTSVLAC